MLPLLFHAFTSVCLLTAPARSAVTTETVVGAAGRRVTLPCRLETESHTGVEVCWGRGEPSLFACHNAVINADRDQVFYRRSDRYSMSSSFSLYIINSKPSDSGFYHCRVQLPGLFNDQTSNVHLIIINQSTELSNNQDTGNLNTPQTTASYRTRDVTQGRGSDVNATGPVVALVQSPVQQQQVDSLLNFIGNTVRLSFIVFIPALLLVAAYRVWSRKRTSDRRPNQSEEQYQDVSSSV